MKKLILLILLPVAALADDRAAVPSWYWGCGDVTPDQCRRMIEARHGVEAAPQQEPIEQSVVQTPPQSARRASPAPAQPVSRPRDPMALKAEEVIRITNEYRQSKGLKPLKIDPYCWDAAFDHAKQMARRADSNHQQNGEWVEERYNRHAPPGKRFSMGESVNHMGLEENVGEGRTMTPDFAVHAWIQSPGHHANLLRTTMTHIGVGVARGRCSDSGDMCWYYSQCFSRKK